MAISNTLLIPGAEHSIPVDKARIMTKLFREQKEAIILPELRGKDILSICETFNREAFDRILRQPACVAIRIYFGMTPEMNIRVIAVGVDAENKDLLPSSVTTQLRDSTDTPPPTEEGVPCPPFCPKPPL